MLAQDRQTLEGRGRCPPGELGTNPPVARVEFSFAKRRTRETVPEGTDGRRGRRCG